MITQTVPPSYATQTIYIVYGDGTMASLNGPTVPNTSTATWSTNTVARYDVPMPRLNHAQRRAEWSSHRRPPHVADEHVVRLEIAVREPPRAMRWFATVARRN